MKGEQDQRSSRHPRSEWHLLATPSPRWWSVHGPAHGRDPRERWKWSLQSGPSRSVPGQSRAISQQLSRSSALGPPHGEGPARAHPPHKPSDSDGSCEGVGAQLGERRPPLSRCGNPLLGDQDCWHRGMPHEAGPVGVSWGDGVGADLSLPGHLQGLPSPPPAPHCLHEGCSAGQKL